MSLFRKAFQNTTTTTTMLKSYCCADYVVESVAGAAADDDSEEEEGGGHPWTSNAIANCTQGCCRRWCRGSCVCRRAGPRLTDMTTVVVKMLGIVSNVVPKLVQRNFRNSLMLPLNECTRTWVAHIHTHPRPLGGNRIWYYTLLDHAFAAAAASTGWWMAVAVLEWCAAVLVVCINREIKCTWEFCHL